MAIKDYAKRLAAWLMARQMRILGWAGRLTRRLAAVIEKAFRHILHVASKSHFANANAARSSVEMHAGAMFRKVLSIVAADLERLAYWAFQSAKLAIPYAFGAKVSKLVGGKTPLLPGVNFDLIWNPPAPKPIPPFTPAQIKAIVRKLPPQTAAQARSLVYGSLQLPPVTALEARELVFGSGWTQRILSQTRLTMTIEPKDIANVVFRGLTQRKTIKEIEADLKVFFNGFAGTAQRIARNEMMRIANDMQMRCYESFGDTVVGYQVHAILDTATRQSHRDRDGTKYYKDDRPGKKSVDDMPRPPYEANGDLAWNCRCWLTPLLDDDPEGVTGAIPSSVIAAWFDESPSYIQRATVGDTRFELVRRRLGRSPVWADFIDPSGRMLTADQLRRKFAA